ncbi:MAG: orotidine-5'-phosphate decarboxylase [Deltaproteobacteria bacterium]|nr:orotidine-5'-phosphate decarboxylase [Deltaproteobacteria bacterium]
MTFSERLSAAVRAADSCLCIGIDPWLDRLPGRADSTDTVALVAAFARAVVLAAEGQVPAVKPQFAFFEQLGPPGMAVLADTCKLARERGLVVIGDAKRGDIGSTASAYASATLSPGAPFPCDALTVSPFLGPDTLDPFLEAADRHQRGLFVLLRTSNPGSHRWQGAIRDDIAGWIEAENQRRGPGLGPVGAVVGATKRDDLQSLRDQMPGTWFLVPGFGAQGASAADARAALRPDGLGALVASARGATFPSAPDADYDADPQRWIRSRIAVVKAEIRD